MTARPIFALVAGEASGDQLGAALIRDLRKQYPDAVFAGIGGTAMRSAGMEIWWDCEELAVFGLFEVLQHFPRLLKLRRHLRRRLSQLRPDAFIGIDAPDFNLGLEKQIKKAGIRTIHYVSPTVWAWRPRRVKKIASAADLVLCLFPFEPGFYKDHGVTAVYVGHPMADQIPEYNDVKAARAELGLDQHKPVVALLPGSRGGEVSRLAPHMLDAAVLIRNKLPQVTFIAAITNPRTDDIFKQALENRALPEIKSISGKPRTVMAAADVVICASGTATLEAMLVNRPLVMVYRVAAATYTTAKTLKLVKLKYFALPNILAEEALVPELLQHDANGERIAQESIRFLQDEKLRSGLSRQFSTMHGQLRRDASKRAAGAISDLLDQAS